MTQYKTFGFIRKDVFTAMVFFSCIVLNACSLKYVSMNNQECKLRPKILNVNSNESSLYSQSILVNKCSGSFNNINDPYTTQCVPDVIKDMNIRVLLNMNINEYLI